MAERSLTHYIIRPRTFDPTKPKTHNCADSDNVRLDDKVGTGGRREPIAGALLTDLVA
jgi:hypothetical protein